MRHKPEVAMNKPVILSLGAMLCALLVFAVPSYKDILQEKAAQGDTRASDTVTGKHWQCVTQSGPDAPNMIVLRENGSFLKLIDYSEVSDNGSNYDLQGQFDIKQDQLLARISKPSGEVYTDAYTVKHMDGGKMQMTRSVSNTDKTDTENTRYNCNMLASRS
jgi:PAS domain-containing protein